MKRVTIPSRVPRSGTAAICATGMIVGLAFSAAPSASAFDTDTTRSVVALVKKGGGEVDVVTYPSLTRQETRETVEHLQNDGRVQAVDVVDPSHKPFRVLSDPYANKDQQWASYVLDFPNARKHSNGAGVTVAVLDTGINVTHSEFDGVLDVQRSFSTAPAEPYIEDLNGHGTHVAGIIAGQVDGRGIEGLAPGVTLVAGKVLDGDGEGEIEDVAEGIIKAADLGVDVISMSLGSESQYTVLDEAVDYARSKGVLVVAAAGNNGHQGNLPFYPAATPGVFAVGATTANDLPAYFSNHNSYVDVAAPGQAILSSYTGSGENGYYYKYMSGTSMATPYAAATAALVLSADPALLPDQVENIIKSTAKDVFSPGVDDYTGAGRINPAAAVAETLHVAAPTQPDPWVGEVPDDDNRYQNLVVYPSYQLTATPTKTVSNGDKYWTETFSYHITCTVDGKPKKGQTSVFVEWSDDGTFTGETRSDMYVNLTDGVYTGALPNTIGEITSHQAQLSMWTPSGRIIVTGEPTLLTASLNVNVRSNKIYARVKPHIRGKYSLQVKRNGVWKPYRKIPAKSDMRLRPSPKTLGVNYLKRSWRVHVQMFDPLTGNPSLASKAFKIPERKKKGRFFPRK